MRTCNVLTHALGMFSGRNELMYLICLAMLVVF
uniref:Uncharacterized protein n=1 Tax=Arundo donax TaxID=35708 RepID=A0A0A8ZMD8_ARUDO